MCVCNYNDGIEILSREKLAPLQTINGFYKGHSIPVNEKLSELFLQLHISEKTGRGIPKIIEVYGKESIDISDNTILVTIPFNRVNKVGDKVGDKNLNISQIKVLAEIRNNPDIHPFNDGNGRMSRLLTTLLLYRSGYVVGKYISLEKKIQITKNEYYNALSSSSKNWMEETNDETPFIKYLLGTILAAYRDFEERVNLVSKKLTSKEMVVNAINTKFGKFTKSDILELCPEIGRATVENVLKELVEEGIIDRVGSGRSTAYLRKN